ncbi:MAG: PorT family protein [Bacteroides sp.]|nr:PorT family protein [Bacteroides sp.]
MMRIKLFLVSLVTLCLMATTTFAQNRWGIMGGGLMSKSTVDGSYFRGGGYIGGLYDIKVSDSWFIQPQLLFNYEEYRTDGAKYVSSHTDFYSKFSVDLPVMASFNVAIGSHTNLRINAGPYISMALFGRERAACIKGPENLPHVGLGTWGMSVGDRITYGVKGGLSLETKHFFYSVDCKYSLNKHQLFQDGHGLTLSAGIGYKF